jgi:hypothetical protein
MKKLYASVITFLMLLISIEFAFGQCSNISTLNCSQIKVTAPVALNFNSSVSGTLENTGFTMVDAPTNGGTATVNAPGLDATKLTLTGGGELNISTTAGIMANTVNSQLNALGVGLEPVIGRKYEMITRINNLPTITANSFQQGGIWFGLDEGNYIKLVAISSAGAANTHDIQLAYESANVGGASFTVNDVAVAGSNLVLKLTIDPINRTALGEYSTNGGTTFTAINNQITNIATNLLNGKVIAGTGGPANSINFAGVFGTNRNSATSVNYLFDYFNINLLPANIVLSTTNTVVDIIQNQSKTSSIDLTTSDNQLITLNIDAKDAGNNTPIWIKKSGNLLNNYGYTLNASPELIFDLDATGLAPGDYVCNITFSAVGYNTNTLQFTLRVSAVGTQPFITSSNPADAATNVALNYPFTVSANSIIYPNAADANILSTSVNSSNVKLFRLNGVGVQVEDVPSTSINDTGGGDAITFTALNPLLPNTRYRFVITSGVTTTQGTAFMPFTATFTTGDLATGNNNVGMDLASVRFNKVDLGSTARGRYATLTFGPDGKLYGSGMDGTITRWTVAADGTLSNKEILSSILNANGARFIMGLAFDPASTAGNLIAYVTHSTPTITAGPEWDGKITRLSGSNLQSVQDIVINLPRSTKDHLTNSLTFGPDGNLYIVQGSNSAAGAADAVWGNRAENLLSGAILKLNLQKLFVLPLPLNAQTTQNQSVINNAPPNAITMSDGTYNPYATNSPLTIYGSGVRNAYDLVWHSNGFLYAPANGTAAGGNTPASVVGTRRPDGTLYSTPSINGTTNIQVQRDWLFKLPMQTGSSPAQEFVGYYGHPNPLRGEYVINRGSQDNTKYPAGTLADANYRGAAFDFEFNKSPNGVIEYSNGTTFGGILKNKLIVARFSGGSDLIILELDPATKDVLKATTGLTGMTGFDNPLELTEDPNTGNLYISEYDRDNNGVATITLLRAPEKFITINPSQLSFTGIQGKSVPSQTINVSVNSGNPGTITLSKRPEDTWLLLPDVVKTGNLYNITPVAPSVQIQAGVVNIGVNTASLVPGIYQGQITASVAGYSPAILNVYLRINAPNSATPPTVSWTFEGSSPSLNVFRNEVVAKINAVDNSGTGIVSTEFSVNGGSFKNYLGAVLIDEVGTFTLVGKVTDGNSRVTTTPPVTVRVIQTTPSGAKLYAQNMDGFPEDDHLSFARIQVPFRNNGPNFAANHDIVTLRLHNNGTSNLIINNLIISDLTKFSIFTFNNVAYTPAQLPFSVAPDGFVDVQVQFIGQDLGGRRTNNINAGVDGFNNNVHETLTIISNDDFSYPNKVIYLHGLWMKQGEGLYEPNMSEIIDAFGLKTDIGFYYTRSGATFTTPIADEIMSPRFVRADPSRPAYTRQLNAYHGCCRDAISSYWVGTTNVSTRLTSHVGFDGQSILPRRQVRAYSPTFANYGPPAEANFSPTTPFIFRINNDYTDRTRNFRGWVGLRVWKLRNAKGFVVPNAYIMAHDFLSAGANFDYNDNGFLVTNVKPELGSAFHSPLLTNKEHIDFENANTGSDNTTSVIITNGGVLSVGDPNIIISRLEIVGDSRDEFTATLPPTLTLNPEASTTFSVSFRPQTVGLKNAALLIHYNSGDSPLRIPLYGIAGANCFTTVLVNRIKMARNTATGVLTLNGKTWNPDQPFRTSTASAYQLDNIADVTSVIKGSDDDAIYRSYMSSSGNLVRYRYAFKNASNQNLPNGFYWVRLHFAENYWTSSGQRINDISLEGQKVLPGFDIYQQVGFKKALVKDFYVEVTGGALELESIPLVDRPAISGVEIFRFDPSSTINITAPNIVAAPCGTTQGSITLQANNTANPVLYKVGRLGNYQTSPTFNNLSAGTYTFFVKENIVGGCEVFNNFTINSLPANIQFDALIKDADCGNRNGSIIISNIIGGTAPYTIRWSHNINLAGFTASDLSTGSFTMTVTDAFGCSGARTITVAKEPDCTPVYAVNAFGGAITSNGITFVTDNPTTVFAPNTNNGLTTATAIANATPYLQSIYQSARTSTAAFGLSVPSLTNGLYYVTLHFAELSNASVGNHVFNVAIEGTNVLTNFDVRASAGASYTAVRRSFPVNMADGTLNINFAPVTNQIRISAIEVRRATVATNNNSPVVTMAIPNQTIPFNVGANFVFNINTFVDTDGDPLTYIATLSDNSPLPAWLTFSPLLRRFDVANNAPVGTYDIKVIATDPTALSASTNFTITIQPPNAPIVANAIPNQLVPFNTAASFTFNANTFFDAGNSLLTYTAILGNGNPLPAWLTFDGNTRTFNIAANNNVGTHQIRVTATNTNSLSVNANFNIVIQANQPPVVANLIPTLNSPFNTANSFAFNANTFSDPEGGMFTYAAILDNGNPLPAWLTFNGTTRTFDIAANINSGAYLVRVTATDNGGLSVATTFTINILPSNDPVVANAIPNQDVPFNTASNFTFDANTFSDPINSPLTYTAILDNGNPLPAWLTLNGTTRTFDIAASTLSVGSYLIRVTATNANGLFVSTTFTLTIQANQPPTVANATPNESIAFNTSASFDVADNTFFDPEDGVLTYTAILDNGNPLPTWLTFNPTTGQFVVAPNTNVGDYLIRITATDNGGLSVATTFTVKILASNALFVANLIPDQDVAFNTAYNFVFDTNTFSDPSNGVLTYASILENGSPLPTWLTFNPTTRQFDVAANNNVGTYSVRVTATNPSSLFASTTFNLTILANQSPTVANAIPNKSVNFNTVDSHTFAINTFSDPEGGTFTYTAMLDNGNVLPTWLTFNPLTRRFDIPANATNGSYVVRVTATDNGGLTVATTFTLNVLANPVPVVVNAIPDKTLPFNTAGTHTFVIGTFNDPNNSPLTYGAILDNGNPLPTWLTFDGNTRTFSIAASTSSVGNYLVRVTATNANSLFVSTTFTLTIQANQAPTVANMIPNKSVTFNTADNHTFAINTFNDTENGMLTYTAIMDNGNPFPTWLTFDANTRTFTISANTDVGTYKVRVAATDNGGLIVATTFDITIQPSNAPTVANAIPNKSVPFNTVGTHTFAANTFNDPNGDVLTYTATLDNGNALPTWLTFDNATRTFAITANINVGSYVIKVIATDPSALSTFATFTLTIQANQAPTIANVIPNKSVTFNTADSHTFATNTFADPESGLLTYSAILDNGSTLPTWLTFSGATRTFAIAANTNVGTYKVRVTATDNGGLTVSTTFDITILPDATPMVANLIPNKTVPHNTASTHTFDANTFSDPNNTILTYATTLGNGNLLPAWLTFDNATRTFTIAANINVGIYTIKVRATNPANLFVETTFTLTIQPNQAPTVINVIPNKSVNFNIADSYTFDANTFNDAENGTLTYSAMLDNGNPLPTWLTFNGLTRTFTIAANTNSGTYLVRVTATDNGGLSVATAFSIIVAPNPVPTVANIIPDKIVPFFTASVHTFDANTFFDPNGDVLTYTATLGNGNPLPTWLAFNPTTRTFNIAANTNVAVHTIKVKATNTSMLFVETTFTITIQSNVPPNNVVINPGVNRAPIANLTIPTQTMPFNTSGSFTFASNIFFEPDNNVLIYSASLDGVGNLPTWLTFNPQTRTFNIGASPTSTGTYTIKVVAADFGGLSAFTTFTLIILPNKPPVANTIIQNQIVPFNTLANFAFDTNVFSDPDGGVLTYTATLENGNPLPNWLTFNPQTRQFEVAANTNVGTYTVKVTATDNGNASVTTSFTVTILPKPNTPPVAGMIPNQTVPFNTLANFTFDANTFSDPDGDVLTLTATLSNGSPLPAWLSFDTKTRTFAVTPNSSVGVYIIRVTATDKEGLAIATTFQLTIQANNPPIANIIIPNQIVPFNTRVSFAFDEKTFSDPEGNELTYGATLENGNSLNWLTFDASTRTFTVAANANVGTYTIKVTATDNGGASVTTSFTVTILPKPNKAPVVGTIPNQTVPFNKAKSFTFDANTFTDADNDVLTFTATLENGSPLPEWLAFDANTRTFVVTANTNVGTYTIKVVATDAGGLTVATTFTVTIEPKPAEPIVLLNLYPNPSTDGIFLLDFPSPSDTFVDLTIVNMSGSVVYERKQVPLVNGALKGFVINLGGSGLFGGVADGTYILRIQSQTQNVAIKMVRL